VTEVHVAVRAHVRLELFPEAFVVDRKLLDERAVASLGFFDDGAGAGRLSSAYL